MKVVDPKKLFAIRKDRFKRQEDFASKMGIEHKTYSAKEKSGKFSPTEIKHIAELLKCLPDDFMSDDQRTAENQALLPTDQLTYLTASIKILKLIVTELQMKSTGGNLVDTLQDIEDKIRKEMDRMKGG